MFKSIIFIMIILSLSIKCSINEPVDEDYFMNEGLILGGAKPKPPPKIKSCTLEGDLIKVDFTDTETIDPDTENWDNLIYLFYWSSTDPDTFDNPKLYYDKIFLAGSIEHAKLPGGEKKVELNPGDYSGTVYIWMTAYDGGRESEYSDYKIVPVN